MTVHVLEAMQTELRSLFHRYVQHKEGGPNSYVRVSKEGDAALKMAEYVPGGAPVDTADFTIDFASSTVRGSVPCSFANESVPFSRMDPKLLQGCRKVLTQLGGNPPTF